MTTIIEQIAYVNTWGALCQSNWVEFVPELPRLRSFAITHVDLPKPKLSRSFKLMKPTKIWPSPPFRVSFSSSLPKVPDPKGPDAAAQWRRDTVCSVHSNDHVGVSRDRSIDCQLHYGPYPLHCRSQDQAPSALTRSVRKRFANLRPSLTGNCISAYITVRRYF